jgi:hypothetical protein
LQSNSDASVSLKALLLEALSAKRILCAIGREWLVQVPNQFCGVMISNRDEGRWKVLPQDAEERVRKCLSRQSESCAALPSARRAAAAVRLTLNEPWDVLALWLTPVDAELRPTGEQLRRLLKVLTPDIAVCAVLLLPGNDAYWWWREKGAETGDLPNASVEAVVPTLLRAIGVPIPPQLGQPVDLLQTPQNSGYTSAEEREIQKRLEDLGYL